MCLEGAAPKRTHHHNRWWRAHTVRRRLAGGCRASSVLRAEGPSKAKVCELDDRIVRRTRIQDVFRLEVAVHDFFIVQVFQCAAEREDRVGSILLRVVALGNNPIEELATRDQLQDERHLLCFVPGLEQPDDVVMVTHPHDLDLACDVVHILHLRLVYDFDGHNIRDLATRAVCLLVLSLCFRDGLEDLRKIT